MLEYRFTLRLSMEVNTGKPYYLSLVNGKSIVKTYESSDLVVPLKYRRWLQGDGNIYNYLFNHWITDGRKATISEIVDNYPEWTEDWAVDFDWDKELHDDFYEALLWFMTKGIYDLEYWYD